METTVKETRAFHNLMLSEGLMMRLDSIGFKEPTEVQHQVIPLVFMGRDVVACAQTGTGKTASFALPLIDILVDKRSRARMPRTLVLVPTRELAQQVTDAFALFSEGQKLAWVTLIGGASIGDQERQLNKGVDIVVATPGRFLDLVERGKILLTDLQYLVIDEADRMLDMGFIPDVERILKLLTARRQTLMFTATLPDPIRELVKTFLDAPKEIFISPQATTAATVEQYWLAVTEKNRVEAVRWLLKTHTIQSAFIFCNRKKEVDTLSRRLQTDAYNVAPLHGDMSQHKRQETLELFRQGKVTILVASDVAARGIDIQDVSHVINFGIPTQFDDYVHRIGRTGRAGKKGEAYTLISPDELKNFDRLKKIIRGDLQKVEWISQEKQDSTGVSSSERRASARTESRGRGRFSTSSHSEESNVTCVGFGKEVPAFFIKSCRQNTSEGSSDAKTLHQEDTKTAPERAPREEKSRRKTRAKPQAASVTETIEEKSETVREQEESYGFYQEAKDAFLAEEQEEGAPKNSSPKRRRLSKFGNRRFLNKRRSS